MVSNLIHLQEETNKVAYLLLIMGEQALVLITTIHFLFKDFFFKGSVSTFIHTQVQFINWLPRKVALSLAKVWQKGEFIDKIFPGYFWLPCVQIVIHYVMLWKKTCITGREIKGGGSKEQIHPFFSMQLRLNLVVHNQLHGLYS